MHVRPAPAPTELIWTRGSNTDSLVLQPTKKVRDREGEKEKSGTSFILPLAGKQTNLEDETQYFSVTEITFLFCITGRKGLETSSSSHHFKTKHHFSSPAELGYRRWPPDCSGLSAGHFSDQQCTSQAFLLCRTPSPTCILPAETMALHLTVLGSRESRGMSLLPLI